MTILVVLHVIIMMIRLVSSCYEGHFLNGFGKCIKCPDHCQHCISSRHCSACEDGYWGTTCKDACLNCYPGTSCEKENGFCLDKCKDGYTGSLCDSACDIKCFSCNRTLSEVCGKCSTGLYGVTCDKQCSSFCFNNTCDDTGRCNHGCQSGYWGQMCEHSCSKKCKDSFCNRQNGTCIFGCLENYTGATCNIRTLDTTNEKQQTQENDDRADPTQANTDENIGAQNKGVLIGVLSVISAPLFVCAVTVVVYVIRRKQTCCDSLRIAFTTEGRPRRTDEIEKAAFEEVQISSEKPDTDNESQTRNLLDPNDFSMTEDREKETPSAVQEQGLCTPYLQVGPAVFEKSQYVYDFSGKRAYIICKDPINQSSSLWEMVWQENCNVIVKLSMTREETFGHKYWPDRKKSRKFDFISVTQSSEPRITNHFKQRPFEVKKDLEERTVIQLQFTCWPVNGFPDDKNKLLDFRQKLQECTGRPGPVLVHCSDGKNRSGIFIALDLVLTELERRDHHGVPIDQYLNQLPAVLVSTDEQNKFLQRTIRVWKTNTAKSTSTVDP